MWPTAGRTIVNVAGKAKRAPSCAPCCGGACPFSFKVAGMALWAACSSLFRQTFSEVARALVSPLAIGAVKLLRRVPCRRRLTRGVAVAGRVVRTAASVEVGPGLPCRQGGGRGVVMPPVTVVGRTKARLKVNAASSPVRLWAAVRRSTSVTGPVGKAGNRHVVWPTSRRRATVPPAWRPARRLWRKLTPAGRRAESPQKSALLGRHPTSTRQTYRQTASSLSAAVNKATPPARPYRPAA